jgi:peptidoglycan/LPS O-acetylase OafA/YrhL
MVEIDAAINAPCYGWFAAGAFFYLYSDTKRRRFGVCSATAALAGMLANYRLSDPVNNWGLVAVYSVFVSPFFVPATARWFSSRVWVFSGLISYPLYLLHENAGWAMILAMRGTWPSVPVFLLPLVPLALIGSVAWLTAAFLEPLGREVLAGSRRPVVASFTLPRLGACTAVAIVAAAAAAVGTALPMTRGREALEAQVLAEDRATLLPLEESLARERLALEDVQRARQAAEQALRNLERK